MRNELNSYQQSNMMYLKLSMSLLIHFIQTHSSEKIPKCQQEINLKVSSTYCYCGSVFAHTSCENNSEVIGAGEDGS